MGERAYTWGSGYHGQLAQGDTVTSNVPKVSKVFLDMHLEPLVIRCGPTHCFVQTVDGDLYSWGSCSNGELGRDDYDELVKFTPYPGFVEGFDTMVDRIGRGAVVDFACGNQFTVVCTAKYTGPSEEEIIQMEEEEEERRRLEEKERRRAERRARKEERKRLAEEKRKEMLEMNTSRPLCSMCKGCRAGRKR